MEPVTPMPVAPAERRSIRPWIGKLRYALVVAVLLVAVQAPLAWIAPVDDPFVESMGLAGVRDVMVLVGVMGVLVVPLVDTAIMAFVLFWLQKLPIGRAAVVLLYALASTAVYCLSAPEAWRIFPVFAGLAWVFVTRQRSPWQDGFVVAALSHALFDLFIVAIAFVGLAPAWSSG